MSTRMDFNDQFFDEILKSSEVQQLQDKVAKRVLARAKATAPVDSGAYRNGLTVRRVERKHRFAYLVEGTDEKTMLIESKTGNLARALKSAGRG